MDRDLIGYGANPPNPRWPNNARIAVNFVVNFEEGSEASIPDGDPESEWGLTEYGAVNPGVPGRDLAAEGMFAFGTRIGFWRIRRLFAEHNWPLTVFGWVGRLVAWTVLASLLVRLGDRIGLPPMVPPPVMNRSTSPSLSISKQATPPPIDSNRVNLPPARPF